MREEFIKNEIKIDNKKEEKFKEFCDFLLEENKKYNLTAIREENSVYVKHFSDSLKGIEFFNKEEKIIEIGSGAGFPSIPLKINDENLDLTLIEATNKKCGFLNLVKQKFEFKNFEVICSRAEELSKNEKYREKFDKVTARAVAELNVLCELCTPFLKVGGKAVFYKNYSESEIKKAEKALKELNLKIVEIKKYVLNGDENSNERAILVIEKTKKTPEKYPREYKKILSKPL